MMFCAMGSNVILPPSGLWPFPSGLDVAFGSLHGKEETGGIKGASQYKLEETKYKSRNSADRLF